MLTHKLDRTRRLAVIIIPTGYWPLPALTKPTLPTNSLSIYHVSINICLSDRFECLTQSTNTPPPQTLFQHIADTISTAPLDWWAWWLLGTSISPKSSPALYLLACLALWTLTKKITMFTPLLTSSPNLHSHHLPLPLPMHVPNNLTHITAQASCTMHNVIDCHCHDQEWSKCNSESNHTHEDSLWHHCNMDILSIGWINSFV